jgi:hypothetical protein
MHATATQALALCLCSGESASKAALFGRRKQVVCAWLRCRQGEQRLVDPACDLLVCRVGCVGSEAGVVDG